MTVMFIQCLVTKFAVVRADETESALCTMHTKGLGALGAVQMHFPIQVPRCGVPTLHVHTRAVTWLWYEILHGRDPHEQPARSERQHDNSV